MPRRRNRKTTPSEMNPDISVIIPIHKVSDFIGACAESLMAQTFKGTVEYIFVDDCSPDDSIVKLERVLASHPGRDCRIIRHSENRGLPSARNSGLEVARGEYVLHIDGDDYVEPDMLEKLWDKAEECDADIVWCDFFISFGSSERLMKARDYKTADELVRRGYLAGDMKYNVWNKMVRRSLYEDIRFPDGHPMGEDMTMIMLGVRAERVAYVPVPLYHYVKTNASAYTQSMSERNLSDIRFNVDRIESFLRAEGDYTGDLALFKLNVKLPFLLTDDRSMYRLWKEWYPEANAFISANRELPFRTRFLQWMASRNLWIGVRAYYVFVYKFIYGHLYK